MLVTRVVLEMLSFFKKPFSVGVADVSYDLVRQVMRRMVESASIFFQEPAGRTVPTLNFVFLLGTHNLIYYKKGGIIFIKSSNIITS